MGKPKKPEMKELTKMVKALNRAGLIDEIDLDDFEDDLNGLADAFCTAIETIDDAKKGDDIPQKVLTYHGKIFEYVESMAKNNTSDDSGSNDDLQETLEEMSFKDVKVWVKEHGLDFKVKKGDWEDEPDEVAEKLVELYNAKTPETSNDDSGDESLSDKLQEMEYKEFKAFVKENNLELKTKIKKSSFEDDQDELVAEVVALMQSGSEESEPEFNEGELQEKLEDMSWKEVKAFCKDNGLDYKPKKSEWGDDPDDDVEAIIKLMKAKAEPKKTDKKGGKKRKTEKKEKNEDSKKLFKANSKQEKLYNRIVEGDCTVLDLALILNDGKKKDAEKKCNQACHLLARTIAKKVPVTITWSGSTVDEGVVTLTE